MKTIMPRSIDPIAKTGNGGFTLVEVLVSLVVLAIGLLGLAMLQTTGLRYNTNSYSRTQATYLAYDLAERMRGNVPGFQAGDYDVTSLGAANGVVGSSSYSCNLPSNSNCSCDTGTCTNAALAQYDLGQWYYSLDMLLPGAKDAANLSTPERATITRNNNVATITIYWLEQNRDASATTPTTPTSQSLEVEIY
ncbi:MAG TPA: type IV pilus modification protein PilV [Candidatus Methylomirabilis sp.]|nr:type IV pilus modification protein PilV [Candidatus Methylomirabilis sp.]